MTVPELLLWLNLASTLPLVGLIWTIQMVHYPTFHYVAPERFPEFAQFHQRRISYVVVPLMLIELLASIGLALHPIPYFTPWWAYVGLALTAAIWLCTFTVQVPLHQQLTHGYDEMATARLVRTNGYRTILWTTRGAVLLILTALLLGGAPAP